LNRGDSDSEHEAAGDNVQPGARPTSGQDEVEATQIGPTSPLAQEFTPPPVSEETGSILGIVVVFSETHESDTTEPDSRLGRVYPLRDGEILSIGRPQAQAEVTLRTGEIKAPTHCHLFPHRKDRYGYISRHHLTIEVDQLGGTILTDYSLHGIYLENAKVLHRRKDPKGPPESHRVTGNETVILGDRLGEPTDQKFDEQRSLYRLQIMNFTWLTEQGFATEMPT